MLGQATVDGVGLRKLSPTYTHACYLDGDNRVLRGGNMPMPFGRLIGKDAERLPKRRLDGLS